MNENLREQLLFLPAYFQGHLILTLIAMSLGIVVSIPLGIWAAQSESVKRPLLTIVSVIQTIPSVAILALVVALLGGRIGLVPAIIGLALYSMLPIVRNTVTGLEAVAEEVVEAARGIGMSSKQILIQVRIPLALPIIIAGIRTATVWTVGLATLSTLVGATSFGNFIFSGLQTRNLVAVTVGSLAAATMAIVLDAIIGGIQWLAENRVEQVDEKRYRLVRSSVVTALVICSGFTVYSLIPEEEADFIIGGKGFTEQYIIAGLVAAELEEIGFTTEQRLGMGTDVLYEATMGSNIDVYLEYSGTVWTTQMLREDNPGREIIMNEVNEFISSEDGMVNGGRLGFQNLYALAMRRDRAQELGITSIEDLLPFAREMTAAGDLEFFSRPEWIQLRDTYNMDFREKLTFDPALMYTAVEEGQVDVISAYTTDGRVAAFDLLILEDTLGAIPPYDGFLLVAGENSSDSEFMSVLASLDQQISDEAMREANRIVDVEGRPISEAVAYLQSLLN